MLRNQKVIVLFFVLMLAFNLIFPMCFTRARGNDSIDVQAVDNYLEQQVKNNRIPGLAVAIVQGDQIIFQKGYGNAAPGKPVTPQTQFYIGSVTKSFTALAAMQLVEQGKLDLDAPVQQYIPWFKVADPQASATITVRHLLNHTSGMSNQGNPNGEKVTYNLEEEARFLADVRVNAPAGSKYQYFNQNYRLVGLLIEQLSGQSYSDYIRENIFTPLGMTHSTTDPADAPELAQGYSRVFGFPLPQSQVYIPGALPSGYLITTAEDMAKFMLAQLNNQKADGSPLLQPELLEEMRTPPAGIDSNYGMGWMVLENGNTLAHGGALQYFQAFVAMGLKEKTGIVILYNQNSVVNMLFENDTVRNGLLDLMNGKPVEVTYSTIDWALLTLAVADLLNHVRLFRMVPRWIQKTARQPRTWVWIKVLVGILFPLGMIFGLPFLGKYFEGGSASWAEPYGLAPDITVWLLVGMGFNLARSLMHATALLQRRSNVMSASV
jgi:CubicO group peptidase (beta-lactamase class C family)